MTKTIRVSLVGSAVAALIAVGGILASAGSANAVVYCRTVGVPQGCVARPGGAAVVVARPAVAHRPVVYCKTVGVPKGCVMR
jgi:hypothetical protein